METQCACQRVFAASLLDTDKCLTFPGLFCYFTRCCYSIWWNIGSAIGLWALNMLWPWCLTCVKTRSNQGSFFFIFFFWFHTTQGKKDNVLVKNFSTAFFLVWFSVDLVEAWPWSLSIHLNTLKIWLCPDCVITPSQWEHAEVQAVPHSWRRASCLLQVLLRSLIRPEARSAQVRPADTIFPPPSATSHVSFHHLPAAFLSFASPSLTLFHVEQQPRCERFGNITCETGPRHTRAYKLNAVQDATLDHIRSPRWWKRSSKTAKPQHFFESWQP